MNRYEGVCRRTSAENDRHSIVGSDASSRTPGSKKTRVVVALVYSALVFASAGCATAADGAVGASVEVGFSPSGSAESLVLKSIASARASVRLAAYSFTAAPVARALIDAKKRGVDVAVVVDQKANLTEDRSGKSAAALNLLVNAGIPTRTVSAYPIQHSKYAVIDGMTVQTGSYNYSAAAARRNSENVLVISNNRELALRYLADWQRLYNEGRPYTSTY